MEDLQHENTSEQGRRFVEIVKVGLKAVLLHNGNKLPSIQPAGVVHTNETYENLQGLLQKQKRHEERWWNICADLKLSNF